MTKKYNRRPTMGDVAAHAGVDISVVSRVLSKDPALRVRDETRRAVLRSVRELNYRPNMLARGLRTSRSQMIGLILPNFLNPVYASIISGAERAAAELDLVLLVGSTAKGDVAEQRQNSILSSGLIDGLLVAGSVDAIDIEPITDAGVPVLLVNRRSTGIDRYVVIDDARAASMAVEHLVSLGHRWIGHLAGPVDVEPSKQRHVGFLAAMNSAGLRVKRSWVVRAPLTTEGGAAAMSQLLELPHRPTAVIADSVAPSIGALEEARKRGLEVPRDLSVVGLHDVDLLQWIHPGLTTVRTPLEELGEFAVRTIHSASPGTRIVETISGPMELVVRESTAPPPRLKGSSD